jgi:hypothetical protein
MDQAMALEAILKPFGEHPLVDHVILGALTNIDWEKISGSHAATVIRTLLLKRGSFLYPSACYGVLASIYGRHVNLFETDASSLWSEWQKTESLDIAWLFSTQSAKKYEDEALSLLVTILRRIKSKTEDIKAGSPVSFGGYSLFYIAVQLIRNYELSDMLTECATIFRKVLHNPNESSFHKLDCMDALLTLKLPDDTTGVRNVSLLASNEVPTILKCRVEGDFGRYYLEQLELRAYNLLANIKTLSNAEFVYAKCHEYSEHDFPDVRKAAIEAVDSLVRAGYVRVDQAVPFFYSKTFDSAADIRANAFAVLARTVTDLNEWQAIWFRRAEELGQDRSAYVRNFVVSALKEMHTDDRYHDEFWRCISMLRRDPHYIVRLRATTFSDGLSRRNRD